MKKTILVMALLLTLGLLVAGCGKVDKSVNEDAQPQGETPQNQAQPEDSPEAYVDEQIIDENQSIEIGEMI